MNEEQRNTLIWRLAGVGVIVVMICMAHLFLRVVELAGG